MVLKLYFFLKEDVNFVDEVFLEILLVVVRVLMFNFEESKGCLGVLF